MSTWAAIRSIPIAYAATVVVLVSTPGLSAQRDTTENTEPFRVISRTAELATHATVFAFERSCFECKNTDITETRFPKKRKHKSLGPWSLGRIKSVLEDRDSYWFGVQKACTGPFAPEIGVQLDGPYGHATLLLMPECQWGRLITDEPGPFYLYNFRASSSERLRLAITNALSY